MIGLAFLNFLGTILFFGFIFVALRAVFGKMRYATASGRCGSPTQHNRHSVTRGVTQQDEAMKVARERLANSDFSPETFETVKHSLQNSAPDASDHFRRNDSAYNTARMRLAKGDISPDEFEAVKNVLS